MNGSKNQLSIGVPAASVSFSLSIGNFRMQVMPLSPVNVLPPPSSFMCPKVGLLLSFSHF